MPLQKARLRGQRREDAAMQAHAHAMRKGMSWRHAVRDALQAADAARDGRTWQCPTCHGAYHPAGDPEVAAFSVPVAAEAS